MPQVLSLTNNEVVSKTYNMFIMNFKPLVRKPLAIFKKFYPSAGRHITPNMQKETGNEGRENATKHFLCLMRALMIIILISYHCRDTEGNYRNIFVRHLIATQNGKTRKPNDYESYLNQISPGLPPYSLEFPSLLGFSTHSTYYEKSSVLRLLQIL